MTKSADIVIGELEAESERLKKENEFLKGNLQLRSLDSNGHHRWRWHSGWLSKHFLGPTTGDAVKNAMQALEDKRAESARLYVEGVSSPMPRGEKHWKTKLTDDDVRTIKRELSKGVTSSELAKRYGVSRTCLHNILTEKSWGHVTLEAGDA